MPLNVVLFQPEIPPNTGNIIRLCANCGAHLHLIHPLGFELAEKALQRAGLDYHEYTKIKEYTDFDSFLLTAPPGRLFGCTTKATKSYTEPVYQDNDYFIFGPESRGLPDSLRAGLDQNYLIRIPMLPHSRSLNLANAVAIVIYEAWRQLNFAF